MQMQATRKMNDRMRDFQEFLKYSLKQFFCGCPSVFQKDYNEKSKRINDALRN